MPVRSMVVTGVPGQVGQRVVALLEGVDDVDRVVALDTRALLGPDLDARLSGADTVVHLAWSLGPPRGAGGDDPSGRNVVATRRVLDAAAAAGVRSLVHLSSASVYGAWPDNPVPVSEEAALRPNPGIEDVAQRGEAERLVAEWAFEHPAASVAVLRPATILGPGVDSWLSRALAGHGALRPDQADPPRQFVHADDVATAVTLAARERLDGVYNVAPDGSVTGEIMRGLTAGGPTLPVPARWAGVLAHWAWSLHLSNLPPAVLPLLEHPWVVASDRLRAVGWAPRHTSEEAIVAGRPGSRWREMGPSRRQQVTLAAAGVGVASVGAGLALLVIRARGRELR